MWSLIKHLPADSALARAVHGDAATISLQDRLLARIDYALAGANWQRGGGKGSKPKPIELPGATGGRKKADPEDTVQKLRNLGLIPAA